MIYQCNIFILHNLNNDFNHIECVEDNVRNEEDHQKELPFFGVKIYTLMLNRLG